MLGESGFDIPHAIVTDGDRLQGRGYLGLARSCRLIGPARRTEFGKGLSALRESADAVLERNLLATAWANSIFIGGDTLELDVVPLLHQEMKSAYADLARVGSSRTEFGEAVDRVASGSARQDDSKTIIRRIEHHGKGRFAQRLASILETLEGADLQKRIARVYPAATIASGPRDCLHMIAALDTASRTVRDHGIMG